MQRHFFISLSSCTSHTTWQEMMRRQICFGHKQHFFFRFIIRFICHFSFARGYRGKPHHHLTHDATQCSSAREKKNTAKNNETEKRHEIKLMACCEIRIMIMMWRNSRDERPEIGGHCSGRTIDILIYFLHS